MPSSASGARPSGLGDREPAESWKLSGERAEPLGPENGARDQKAEHGADLQALEERHGDGGRREDDDHVAIDAEIMCRRRCRCCVHAPLMSPH